MVLLNSFLPARVIYSSTIHRTYEMSVTMLNICNSEIKVVNQELKQWGTMYLRQYFRNSVCSVFSFMT